MILCPGKKFILIYLGVFVVGSFRRVIIVCEFTHYEQRLFGWEFQFY